MRQSSYSRRFGSPGILGILTRLEPLTLPKNLLLTTGALIALLPWRHPVNLTRRFVPIALAAAFGVAFYHAISPIRVGYHATPQMAVAAVGLTLVAAQLVQGESWPIVRLAVLGALFLLFGAREKPRALEVLTPGNRTYGLGESMRILRTGELPLRPAVGVWENPGYTWSDARAAILYLREHVPANVPIALLLMENRTAVIVDSRPRSSAVPTYGNGLSLVDDPSLMTRVVAALKTTDPCVVLWNPSSRLKQDPRFDPLWRAVQDRFEPEAKFGNIEFWHRRPSLTNAAGAVKPEVRRSTFGKTAAMPST
jgi:hypothetical protein